MIAGLQPSLFLGLAGPWAETVLAVAALVGLGYAWRWRTRSRSKSSPAAEPHDEAEQESPAPSARLDPEIALTPSWVDDLTGLPDVGYLRKKFGGVTPEPEPLTLLTISVQGSAGEQPTGYGPGDRALVEIAHTVRSILRTGDTCVRATSGQLMAVLPGLDADTSGNLVTRVKQALESLTLVTRSGGEIRLAVQVGRACVPQDGNDLDALLEAARKDVQHGQQARGGSVTERLSRATPVIPN